MFLDELSVALRKANKAKYTSDLSSQNDELKTRRPSKREKKRTVGKNKSIRHLSDSESSNLSRSESDTNIYPCPSGLITNGKYLFFLNNKIVFFIIINFTILLDKNLVQNRNQPKLQLH